MNEAHSATDQHRDNEPSRAQKRPLHRVCIQCNHMFRVDPARLDAKQCSNCHKG